MISALLVRYYRKSYDVIYRFKCFFTGTAKITNQIFVSMKEFSKSCQSYFGNCLHVIEENINISHL